MALSVKEIAWVAGLLEGEGCFGLTNNKRAPTVWLSMTDSDVVERIRLLVDPLKSIKIYPDLRKESYKPIYRLTLNGERAVGWMMTIYPLMSIRRKAKIREVLEVWKSTHLDKIGQKRRASQTASSKLRALGYSEPAIEVAKVLRASGLTEAIILERLEALKDRFVH